MDKIIKKNEEYNESNCGLHETLFHNANGYIGVRGCLEEGVPEEWDTMRGTYINGFYDVIAMKQAENLRNLVEEKQTMLNVADTQTVYLKIDKEFFSLKTGTVLKNIRTLNMKEGYTLREIHWKSPKGKEVSISIKRMTSFVQLSLFTIEYCVTPINFNGKISFLSYHIANVSNYSNPNDPRLAAESEMYLIPQKVEIMDGYSLATSKTRKSELSMCSVVAHKMIATQKVKETSWREENAIIFEASVYTAKSEHIVLEKYSVFSDSIRNKNLEETAVMDLEKVLNNGLNYYYNAQKEYLKHFWYQSELEVMGDEGMNQAVSFNMYQLLQSAAKDCHCNIAAKGLSGEGYEGHYFWDTEMFIAPFFTLTNPELSKTLLSYRYDILEAARENARSLGHKKGVLFPWRTIAGKECSGYFPSGTAQYHIDGDIAYAIMSYYHTTGDLDFIKEKGEEILLETARLWLDVGNYSDGKFVINDVTGPDEYTCMINNNYYTNCCAKYNLLAAVTLYKLLKEKNEIQKLVDKIQLSENEIVEMEEAAEKMYLLYDKKMGINPQDDSFLSKPIWNLEETPKEKFPLLLHYHPLHLYRYQVCKQADVVLAYYLFEKEQTRETMIKSYEYYEKITTHDSSLSTCVFSIVASRLGMKKKAYDYFGNSAKLDLENIHNNTKYGIHTANMGGCYMAIVNGFAELRISEKGVSIAPFLPEKWEGYRFKFRYLGNLIRIFVKKEEIIAELVEGTAISIRIFAKQYELALQEKVIVNYK